VLNNALDSDTLYISNTSFGASSALVNVNFTSTNKGDIAVSALDNSSLALTDSVVVNGDFTITATDVTQEQGTLTAQRLILDEVTLIGTSADGIEVNVDELLVQNHSGEVYLNEQDDVVITSLDNMSGLVSLNSDTGSISSSNILTATGELNLTAANDINLLAQNQLTGELSLSAGNNVVLNNDVTDIVALTATNATITSANSLTVSGDINVSSSSANSNEGVLMLSSTSGDINLNGHSQADSLNINAANDITLASVSAKSLQATTANGDIVATGSVIVQQGTDDFSTKLSAVNGSISFESAGNDFDGISLLANNAVIADENGLGLSNVELTNSLIVNANGDVALGTVSAGESIAIDAGAGAILSLASNITAPKLTLQASTGIGTGVYAELKDHTSNNPTAINTNTASLSAINTTSGMINIINQQDVMVTDLRNNGDIVFTNTGDINLVTTELDTGIKGAVDANYGQDILNDVYSGSVSIFNNGQGSIYGIGGDGREDFADIIAENLTIKSVINFGSSSRPIRVRVNDTLNLSGGRALIGYYLAEPRHINKSEDLVLEVISSITALSGQQLVEVESLDEVDPAIFSDVRNYNVDDTSVLLPKDQRNDDEEERAEGEE